jgi:hypothetical protein
VQLESRDVEELNPRILWFLRGREADMRIRKKRERAKSLIGWMGREASLVDLYKYCPSMKGILQ